MCSCSVTCLAVGAVEVWFPFRLRGWCQNTQLDVTRLQGRSCSDFGPSPLHMHTNTLTARNVAPPPLVSWSHRIWTSAKSPICCIQHTQPKSTTYQEAIFANNNHTHTNWFDSMNSQWSRNSFLFAVFFACTRTYTYAQISSDSPLTALCLYFF